MDSFEEKLRDKMSSEDFNLLNDLMKISISRIRAHIQDLVNEAESK